MHTVLRDFVQASRGWFDFVAIEMVEGNSAFANRVALLDGFGDVGFGQGGGFKQGSPGGKMGGDCTGESATGAVQDFFPTLISGEGQHVIAVE
jgi:hypothetical protein